ncbi:permease [Peteryoungia ipomoeae]|uniref:Permease n=1 Tax=Peteryoungia ipomoeae TaxID=1210932 RepID=A0A4S8P1A0_9HYPH|nr:permease [Peteryoungia ipomoeae]THV23005.1 permease [Peteryoungia ipomoeae]
MDFMRLLKSLEELLYELVSWLVFYPLTFWRALSRPLPMMRYADLELGDRPEDQYEDTLSPPLFLLITLMIAQGLASLMPLVHRPDEIGGELSSTANLLIARGVIFSVFPLVMSVTLLRHKGLRLTRESLRPPFYSQCYVAAPFVLVATLGLDALMVKAEGGWLAAGLAAIALAILWYGQAQVRWFVRDLGIGWGRAVALFLSAFAIALVTALCLTVVIGLSFGHLPLDGAVSSAAGSGKG